MFNSMDILNAKLIFRNFSGEKNDFNAEGQRNFSVILDEETANGLSEAGVNIRTRESSDPDEPPIYTMKVNVSYRKSEPTICLITSKGKKFLHEDRVGELDHVNIENADLTVTFSYWEMRGKSGFSAYLDSLYVTAKQSALEEKYADLPTIE